MELSRQLDKMDAAELRNLTATLLAELASRDKELKAKQLKIDQLTHEMAILKRYRFDRRSEQMDAVQRSLLDESIDADIEAISLEIEALKEKPASPPKEKPRRVALAGIVPAPGNTSRAGKDPLQLRLQPGAHRRGCEREARLHPRRVRGRTTHPRQVGLPCLRDG